MSETLGLVYIFTGEGKGKTSAAIGVAVRAVGAGMRVGWVAFYKQASWRLSEMEPLKKLGVEVFLEGRGFYMGGQRIVGSGQKVVDTATAEEHKVAAKKALKKASELIKTVDLMVLDEVNNAIEDGLIKVQEVLQVLQVRKGAHVIITGRDAHPKIVETADLVTEMKKIKHSYDLGKLAVKGLDY